MLCRHLNRCGSTIRNISRQFGTIHNESVSKQQIKRPSTIAVAMSGGIDSAVAALLLQDQGHNLVGVFMKNWDPADECGSETCDLDSDQKDMKEVCQRLGIPAYEVNFVKEYWNEVFAPFLDAYQEGVQTPNPDAFCNRHVKFKHLLNFVNDKLGIETIATGHYSQIVSVNSAVSDDSSIRSTEPSCKVQLLKGNDPLKDQSYFLALAKGSALERVLMPLGGMNKVEVKAIAAARLPGLRILSKPESMGICFIGKRDMKGFLQDYIVLTKGRFIDLDTGAVVGRHEGFEYYTIGQKALISGTPHRYFVVGRKKNTIKSQLEDELAPGQGSAEQVSGDVYVVPGTEHPSLYSPYITQPLHSFNWIAGAAPEGLRAVLRAQSHAGTVALPFREELSYRCECKCRYSQLPTPCTITIAPSDPAASHRTAQVHLKIAFDIPQRAITAGQIVALYDGAVCLGGAVIAAQPVFVDNSTTPLFL